MGFGMGELLRGRFARRLTLSFAALGIGTAVLTAVLVDAAFDARFKDYLAEHQSSRQGQLVSLFAADYASAGGWNTDSLNRLADDVIMTGAETTVLDSAGHAVWSLPGTEVDQARLARHRLMMGNGDLGPVSEVPIMSEGQTVGTLQVRVPQGTIPAVDQSFYGAVNRLLAAGAFAAAVVAVVVGVWTARRTTAPITELTRAAQDLAAGQRDRRASIIPRNEIGSLATAFNTMADRVEKEDELRRLFTADVAHELRTPLAIQRSQLEAIQDGIATPSEEVIASLHEETLRLGRLVADLEALASADAAAFTLRRQELSLSTLVHDTLAALAGSFDQAALVVRTEVDEDITVDGDPVRLRQILTNQLTNAIKFVPAGGTVTISVHARGDWAEINVTDTGPGISAEDLPRIFERFYRSRTARADGSGVGLAVAAELTAAHGGTLTARSQPGQGTTFTTRLPTTKS